MNVINAKKLYADWCMNTEKLCKNFFEIFITKLVQLDFYKISLSLNVY